MVYLEILELNFCGLNENIKRRIMEKGEIEFRNLSEFDLHSQIIDDDDDAEEQIEKKGYIIPYQNI